MLIIDTRNQIKIFTESSSGESVDIASNEVAEKYHLEIETNNYPVDASDNVQINHFYSEAQKVERRVNSIDLYIKEAAYLDNGDFAVICYCNSGFDADKMIDNVESFEISNGDGVLIAAASFNDVNLIIPAMGGVEHRFNFPSSENCVLNNDVDLSKLTWNCNIYYNDVPASDNNTVDSVDNGYVPNADPAAYNDTMRIKTCVGGTASVNVAWQNAVYGTTDKSVASVDSDGIVHAVGEGTAVITASSGSLHSDRFIIVTDPDVYKMYNGDSLLTKWLSVGEFDKINAVWEDSTFISENPSVITVSDDGLVTAVGKGGAVVTVISDHGTELDTYYIVF